MIASLIPPLQVAEIPTSTDRKFIFDLGSPYSAPKEWILALAYGDQVPNHSEGTPSAPEPSMVTQCSDIKVIFLNASKMEASASAPAESDVTSAIPVLVDIRRAGTANMNEFDAAAQQMDDAITKDGRCKKFAP